MSFFSIIRSFVLAALLGATTQALAGARGTSLSGTTSPETTLTATSKYTWSVTKTNGSTGSQLSTPRGQTTSANFTISANRTGPTVENSATPIQGQICLTNTGTTATRGLLLRSRLEKIEAGSWQAATPDVPIAILSQIPGGASACYPYSIDFAIDTTQQYRHRAVASIDNARGWEGMPHEIVITAAVSVQQENRSVDAIARLDDQFSCPNGFTCSPLSQSWTISSSTTLTVNIAVTNDSAPCGRLIQATNVANLIALDSNISNQSTTTVDLITSSCPVAFCPVSTPDTRCSVPSNFNFLTATSGEWSSPSTWVGGLKPPLGLSRQNVNIRHDIQISSGNLNLSLGASLIVSSGGRLTLKNGNIALSDGNQASVEKILLTNASLRSSGSVIQDGPATVFCAANSRLEIGDESATNTANFTSGFFNSSGGITIASFENLGGYRRIEQSCFNVTGGMRLNSGEDQLIGVCGDIGDAGANSGPLSSSGGYDVQDGGSFDVAGNASTVSTICGSELYLPNGSIINKRSFSSYDSRFRLTEGSFTNQPSASITGEKQTIWINGSSLGNISNQGNWSPNTIESWRVDNGSTPIGLPGLVLQDPLANILSRFTCRPCLGGASALMKGEPRISGCGAPEE